MFRICPLLNRLSLLVSAFAVAGAFAGCDDDAQAPVAPPPDGGGLALVDAGAPPPSPSQDAAPEAAATPSDAGDAGDAGPALNGLYVHVDGKLYAADPTTGAFTEIGPTGQPNYIVLARDDRAGVARVVTSPTESLTVQAMPKLGTIDLCTGMITAGPAITLGGTQVLRAEGLAQDPATGTFHVAFGTVAGSSNWYRSERTGTIDIATGAITAVGTHQTVQDDADSLDFIAGSLHLFDTGQLYTLDKATGAATPKVAVGAELARMTFDASRGVTFSAVGAAGVGRAVAALDLATGVSTKIGAGLADAVSPGIAITGLLSAPKPVCP